MATQEERWHERLAVPVLVAALVALPAVFLTLLGGAWAVTGQVVDILSGLVLLGETVVLFLAAADKRDWVRGHVGLIALTLLIVGAVIFAIGPVQVLRLVRTVGALRILRARRIVRAASELRERLGWTGRFSHVFAVVAGLLAAVFIGLVLADPTSSARHVLHWMVGGSVSTAVVVLASVIAGALLGGATFLLARDRGSGADAHDRELR